MASLWQEGHEGELWTEAGPSRTPTKELGSRMFPFVNLSPQGVAAVALGAEVEVAS